MAQVAQNIRIRFSKQGDVRFVPHRDTMRLFERALRRAALPLAMSQGYNPHPRLSLPMPLSVGMAGANEVADFGLRQWVRPAEAGERLQAELPAGIRISSIQSTRPNPGRRPSELSYRVPLLPGHCLSQEAIDRFLGLEEAVVRRPGKNGFKEVEVRQFVKAVRLMGDSVALLLAYSDRGTARPEEVMESLGCHEGRDFLLGDIIRTNVKLSPPC